MEIRDRRGTIDVEFVLSNAAVAGAVATAATGATGATFSQSKKTLSLQAPLTELAKVGRALG